MEDYNKRISGIRMAMKEMKTVMYAITNPETIQLDDYQKSLYMRMLCSVIQYENMPCEMQLLYLKRIHKGIQAEAPVEEYMRQALELTDVNVKECIEYMRESRVRFYFALEGIVLIALGQSEHEGYEYLGEMIELLGITKRELEHISLVAKSVLEQDSECYDRAKQIATNVTAGLDFAPYIENYYVGAIVDTDDEKYYSSPNMESISDSQLHSEYKNRRVTFKNLIIELSKDLVFAGCKEVSFINCKFRSPTGKIIKFTSVGNVKFEQCEFRNFSYRVMIFENVTKSEITECSFENCGWTCNGDKRGGVLSFSNREGGSKFVFCNNLVHGCYIKAETYRYNYGVTGMIDIPYPYGVAECVIKNNEYIGCECRNNGNYTAAIISGISMKSSNLTCSGNRCIGGVTRLFENG